MLRIASVDTRSPGEAYALTLLADLARLPLVTVSSVPAVGVSVDDRLDGDLAWLRARAYGIEAGDGEVRVPRALLEAVVAVAGGAAEQAVSETDRHGRVPSGLNPMVTAGLERVPVMNDAANRLRDAVRRAAGRRPFVSLAPWPEARRWAVVLTHDLDVVDYWPAFTFLRLAELGRRGEIARMARVLGATARALGRNPVSKGVQDVLDVERRHGVRSTWFVLSGTPTFATMRAGDLTYRPEGQRAIGILAAVRAAGGEIALHGSFATRTDTEAFRLQRRRLEQVAGETARGVRQHYIRMRPGTTHTAMRAAGFDYDATYGFPDRNGFRLGVADVVPGWNAAQQAPSDLDEVPLIWMDRALSKYRGVEDPRAWVQDALELAERCREVGGVWVGLWHPNLVPALGFPGAPGAYAAVLKELLDHGPWVATARELVTWRRTRRAARVVGVEADGRVVISASRSVRCESLDGREVAVVRD